MSRSVPFGEVSISVQRDYPQAAMALGLEGTVHLDTDEVKSLLVELTGLRARTERERIRERAERDARVEFAQMMREIFSGMSNIVVHIEGPAES